MSSHVLPAQAGVVRRHVRAFALASGSPRAGGGGPSWQADSGMWALFSPRRRGWSNGQSVPEADGNVLPAQAGGGPYLGPEGQEAHLFSPRRRGWSVEVGVGQVYARVLPAQAGVPRRPGTDDGSAQALPAGPGVVDANDDQCAQGIAQRISGAVGGRLRGQNGGGGVRLQRGDGSAISD